MFWPLCGLLLLVSSVAGQSLTGSLDVTFVTEDRKTTELDTVQVGGVDSIVLDTVEIDRDAITQEYSASLLRNLTPWVAARASVRFFHTGSDQTAIGDVWRQEFQPSGEVNWNHPDFSLIGTVQHRESKGSFETAGITRDNIMARWQSKFDNWPLMQLSYAFEHIYNDLEPSMDDINRDTENHRAEARIEYNYRAQSLLYAASRRWTYSQSEQLALEPINQTLITRLAELETTEWTHLFRWLQMSRFFDRKLRVNSSYNFRYQTQDDQRTGVFRGVSSRQTLFAIDLSPDQGALTTLPGLSDGVTDVATVPAINIGTGETGQNLGFDFGLPQEINAVYVYTDRPSGEQVGWRVYISNDNLTWTEVTGTLGSLFNLAQNRYEIVFETVDARYVKVVKRGFNRIENVFVTEIEAFIQADDIEDETIDNVTHNLDIANTFTASDALELSADFNYIREPAGSFDQTREEYYIGGGIDFEPSERFLHSARVQQGWQDFSFGEQEQSSTTYNYSLIYTPLDRLQMTLAAASLQDYFQDERVQESNSLFWEASGTPFTHVSMSTGISYTRNNRFRFGESFESWTYRGGLDGRLTTALTGLLSASHQRITNRSTDSLRIRNQYTAGIDIRLSRSIFAGADVNILDEEVNTFISQDYTLSWNLSRRLTVGGLASISDDGNGVRTEQYDGRINLRIRTRASLNAGVAYTDFAGAEGFESTSFRIGFRSGF